MAADEHYDDLETRDPEARRAQQMEALRTQIAHAKAKTDFFAALLADVAPEDITNSESLAALPVTRKPDIARAQEAEPPFGGLAARDAGNAPQVFMSPGPVYEPGGGKPDYGRFARCLWAAGMRPGDLIHNTFAYHLTPAGAMVENSAHAMGCSVFPGGVGNTEIQVQAIGRLRPRGYVGTPSFLRILVEKGDEMGVDMSSLQCGVVGAEALTPAVRDLLSARGIEVTNSYGTADIGLIAYETSARDGMLVDEGILFELVEPNGTEPVAEGEVGEIVVSTFNSVYPLIRYGTGDLSQLLPGRSPCGRSNTRIRGWMGRADQSAKFKGMFVHASNVMELAARHPEIKKARLVLENPDSVDQMTLKVAVSEARDGLATEIEQSIQGVLKLRGAVAIVEAGDLPDDGRVIDDARKLD